jgi:hypothetical protein
MPHASDTAADWSAAMTLLDTLATRQAPPELSTDDRDALAALDHVLGATLDLVGQLMESRHESVSVSIDQHGRLCLRFTIRHAESPGA